jgi:hypothetical protein
LSDLFKESLDDDIWGGGQELTPGAGPPDPTPDSRSSWVGTLPGTTGHGPVGIPGQVGPEAGVVDGAAGNPFVESSSSGSWNLSGGPPGPFDVSVPPTLVQMSGPFAPKSDDESSPPKPLSAIAARRSQGKQDLIQPEQDVIYKQYNPNPPATPPPTTSVVSVGRLPHGHAHTALGMVSGGVAPAGLGGGWTPPHPQVLQVPVSMSPPALQVSRFMYESPPQPFAREVPRKEQGGLRVFCTIGFGGRVVMGGGRFGTKMSLFTLRDAFRDESFLREIESIPSPLGSVSDLVTEQVVAYCDSRSSAELGRGSSSWLMWKYLGHQVRRSRDNFLPTIWEQAIQEHGIDTKSVLFEYMSRVVEGNLREALKIASERAPELHAVSMAIASIHSPEFFREAILQYANSMTNPCTQSLIPSGPLLEVVRMTITVFASTSAIENLFISREDHFVQYWKLYLCAIACLIKPSGTVSGGVAFLVKLGELLASRNQVSEGHLCLLISGKVQSLDSVDSSNALMCLVGSNHRDIGHFDRLLDPEALHMSEVLEYSKRVSQQSPLFIPLQPWKYAYASMLASDLGLFDLAEKYIDVINAFIRAVPTGKYSVHFRNGIRELESRIHGSCGRKPPEIPTAASTLSSLLARIL